MVWSLLESVKISRFKTDILSHTDMVDIEEAMERHTSKGSKDQGLM